MLHSLHLVVHGMLHSLHSVGPWIRHDKGVTIAKISISFGSFWRFHCTHTVGPPRRPPFLLGFSLRPVANLIDVLRATPETGVSPFEHLGDWRPGEGVYVLGHRMLYYFHWWGHRMLAFDLGGAWNAAFTALGCAWNVAFTALGWALDRA